MRWWTGSRMDDLALLDLLECPVCFERLDGTAKVLPCQHTFCKPCLQQISHSHKEVRCPECRSPVTGSIDDLPVNLLLVRLLDGIRYGQTNARVTHQPPADQHSEPVKSRSSLVKTLSPAHSPLEQVPCARALYTYSGQKPGDLSFSKGDLILLRQQVDENWFYGEISGACGIFPLGFVHVIHHLPQLPPLCKALYDFTLQETEQPAIKNVLPFVKNNILKVIRRVDENWAEGKLGERVGIFPISFVEMNSTAKQLLSVKRVDVKSVQSHSSPTVGNPRLSLTHAETGNPRLSLTHTETAGNPRLSLTHTETGNPRLSLTHAETGNPRLSLTHVETGKPRLSLTDTGNPSLSLTHAETGNPRLSLTDTGNPRLSLTHTETGNPRLSLTHTETGNPRLSLTHTETAGNPRVELTHAETGNPHVSLTHRRGIPT
ncbi:E3 ubiquitin-protein ligase SH3RF2-like [Leucoraja erinacea]|uniref:E3 ubiquitin-protein ligase SH3RF2-like n=1 Tax=Leucoraja erinaceus TaxID=7782 RepID=UPI002456C888|nr:E3 ubiquitin-protein ligase SH3RF2-like [Leucoraja erinacea]